MNSVKTKIAIVGAGPAGATLALLLAKRKIPHVLIDKETFPRDKVCGDGYTAEVLKILKEIDESLYQEFINASWTEASYGTYVELSGGVSLLTNLKKDFKEGGLYFVAKRQHFDAWMVSKIDNDYTETYFDCEVKSIQRLNEGLRLSCLHNKETFEVQADLVIGADGERSVVRKHLDPKGIKKVRAHHAAAIRCYYKNVRCDFDHKPLELYQIRKNFSGYFWIFNLPNNEVNIGIGALSDDVSKHKTNIKQEMFNFIENHPVLKKRFEKAVPLEKPKGWGIPMNSDAYDFTGDNYILIGDSAKFGEPLTGKGIGVAMQASSIAVPFIEEAINSNDYSNTALRKYEDHIQKKFRKEWHALYLSNQKMHKWYVPWMFKIVKLKPIINYLQAKHIKGFNKFVFNK